MGKAVILFDGECNLCSGAVAFLLDRDPAQHFVFASLQSLAGQRLLRENGFDETPESIVLIESGNVYTRSTAALRIARRLNKAWPLLAVLLIVPAPVRDVVYRFIARNRYKWFGKRDTCLLPTPERRSRFLA